jgi:hypothetical protein
MSSSSVPTQGIGSSIEGGQNIRASRPRDDKVSPRSVDNSQLEVPMLLVIDPEFIFLEKQNCLLSFPGLSITFLTSFSLIDVVPGLDGVSILGNPIDEGISVCKASFPLGT